MLFFGSICLDHLIFARLSQTCFRHTWMLLKILFNPSVLVEHDAKKWDLYVSHNPQNLPYSSDLHVKPNCLINQCCIGYSTSPNKINTRDHVKRLYFLQRLSRHFSHSCEASQKSTMYLHNFHTYHILHVNRITTFEYRQRQNCYSIIIYFEGVKNSCYECAYHPKQTTAKSCEVLSRSLCSFEQYVSVWLNNKITSRYVDNINRHCKYLSWSGCKFLCF